MPVPVFTTGEVLTAANMNQVGLWLVKSQTVGSGVSSVTVTGAFSADYDNYRIIYANATGSSIDWLNMTLNGASGVSYTWGHYFIQIGVTTGSTTSAGATSWRTAVMGNRFQVVIDVCSPFLTARTTFTSSGGGEVYFSTGGGMNTDLTSSTGFTLTPATGTLTGGTIRVYGLRN